MHLFGFRTCVAARNELLLNVGKEKGLLFASVTSAAGQRVF